jgi:hypothetical protein
MMGLTLGARMCSVLIVDRETNSGQGHDFSKATMLAGGSGRILVKA